MRNIILLFFTALFMATGVYAGDGNGSAVFGSKTNNSVFGNYGQKNLNADAKEIMNFGKSDKEQGFMLHTQSGATQSGAIQAEVNFNSKAFVNLAVKSNQIGTPNSLYFGAYQESAGLTENAGDVNETYGYMNHKETKNIKKIVDTFAYTSFIKKKMLASSAFVKTHNVPNLEKTTHNINLTVVNDKNANSNNFLTGSAVFAYVNGASTNNNYIKSRIVDVYTTNTTDLEDNTAITATNTAANTKNTKIIDYANSAYFTNTFNTIGAGNTASNDGEFKIMTHYNFPA